MEYQQTDWTGRRQSYAISYQALKEEHARICMMSNDEFMQSLAEVIHLACVISWFKELGVNETLGDCGIIHELAHLMHIPEEPLVSLPSIRNQFRELLKL